MASVKTMPSRPLHTAGPYEMSMPHPQIFLDPSNSQMSHCFIHKRLVEQEFVRGSGEKRAFQAGEQHQRRPECPEASGLGGKEA